MILAILSSSEIELMSWEGMRFFVIVLAGVYGIESFYVDNQLVSKKDISLRLFIDCRQLNLNTIN